ncbi:4'-phosphopantetheinyl transferase family protein, partial [Bacteroides pyogenes F0041]
DMAVEMVEGTPFATGGFLFQEERTLVRDSWSEVRLKTFILGRCAAHSALLALKEKAFPVLKGEKGEPIWAGDMVGSISHKDTVAVAAVGRKKKYKGIGIDIEDRTIALTEKEYALFCTPEEIRHIERKTFSPVDIFSRKEAVWKAYYVVAHAAYDWMDIDTIQVSERSDMIKMYMFNKGKFVINVCCIEKES